MGLLVDYLVGPHHQDERVAGWPLVHWKAALAITALYIGGVAAGVQFMRQRKPVDMKAFSVAHNLFMFCASLYMVIETVRQASENMGWLREGGGWLWGNVAEAPGRPFSPSGHALARVLWLHYLSKAYEFTDTLIMILKKKERQISFLHVYHHATTFFPCWWAAINFAPGGDVWFTCALNSSVHVFMYGYYLAAAVGVKVPKAVKQAVTSVQLVQFGLFFLHALYGMLIAAHYRPRIVVVLCIFQAIVFASLFGHFFWHAYVINGKRQPVRVNGNSNGKARNGAAGAKAL